MEVCNGAQFNFGLGGFGSMTWQTDRQTLLQRYKDASGQCRKRSTHGPKLNQYWQFTRHEEKHLIVWLLTTHTCDDSKGTYRQVVAAKKSYWAHLTYFSHACCCHPTCYIVFATIVCGTNRLTLQCGILGSASRYLCSFILENNYHLVRLHRFFFFFTHRKSLPIDRQTDQCSEA